MSRMTKFLRQKCQLEQVIFEEGLPKLNDFGELQYAAPVSVKCRHESSHKDIQTTNGSIVRSTSRYFLDESVPVAPDDRIDGRVVVSVVEYVNGLGLVEGYEVYV